MYSISGYGEMIADQVRMAAFSRALRKVITTNSVVVDIGSGTGIFAMLACKFGARRVHAIEPADAIQIAREVAVANGYGDRIVCHQIPSTRVVLPERADVIVSDLRGVLPYFGQHIPSIVDARERFLANGGSLIPVRDSLWAAVVTAENAYADYDKAWGDNSYELNWEPARRIVLNSWRKERIKSDQLMTDPELLATLDYTTIQSPDLRAEANFVVAAPGIAHGLCVWFETELADEIGFTNAPGASELVYGQAFFPLWEALRMKKGDEVAVKLRADLTGDDYVWCWETRLYSGPPGSHPTAELKQSTFFSVPLSPKQLHKRSADHVPVLSEEGEAEKFALTLMNGTNKLEEIAQQLALHFPHHFNSPNASLTFAGEISLKYGR
jgi:protein arginine N-methyltransferase 1